MAVIFHNQLSYHGVKTINLEQPQLDVGIEIATFPGFEQNSDSSAAFGFLDIQIDLRFNALSINPDRKNGMSC